MLAALSIQLALYATAWYILGRAFKLESHAVLSWSAAWGVLSAVTALLANPQWADAIGFRTVMNSSVIAAFVILLWGSAKSTHMQIHRLHLWGPLLGAAVIDLLRYGWFAETALVRWIGFAVCITWPVALMVRNHTLALKRIGFFQLTLLVWVPGILVVCFFSLRAYILLDQHTPATQAFTGLSALDQIGIGLFLISLGALNFAQAAFLIGSLVRRLQTLSATDQLTQLANRRTLLRHLGKEHARYRRTERSYVIMMFDLDHFKNINDTHGHAVGDRVLKEVGAALTQAIRCNDVLARYGGEEFMVLMPEIDVEVAKVLAERLRQCIAGLSIPIATQDIPITASIGVSGALPVDLGYETVIKRADEALYLAKRSGRNQVQVHGAH